MSDTVTAVEAVHASATQPRGERGRWGARTRTVKQQAARSQAAFIDTLTEDDVKTIARKLIEQARNGDNTSARLVLKYGFGELLSHMATDGALESEAKEAARAPRSSPPPTAEEVMAAVRMRMQEQQALEADILRMGGGGKPAAGVPASGGNPPRSAGR